MFYNGRAGEVDFINALEYFLLASSQGHRDAQYILGTLI